MLEHLIDFFKYTYLYLNLLFGFLMISCN